MAMLCDCQSRENHQKAVDTIVQIREKIEEEKLSAGSAPKKRGRKPKPKLVRSFKKTTWLNWDAETYVDLLNWDEGLLNLEPPITMDFTAEQLKMQVDDFTALGIPSIPAHTQAQSFTITPLSKF